MARFMLPGRGMDLLTSRTDLAREWLRMRAERGPDSAKALAALEAISAGQRPSEDVLGWLAGQAADGSLAARIVMGVV